MVDRLHSLQAHVFPARAGMSPDTTLTLRPSECVPRVSGDEPPQQSRLEAYFGWSPRASGDEPTTAMMLELLSECSLRERG